VIMALEFDEMPLCLAVERARREHPEARRQVQAMYERARWERYWRNSSFYIDDPWPVAAATAEVDRMACHRAA
jgi:hypothetical protein